MNLVVQNISVTIIVSVLTVIITHFLSLKLRERSEYSRLRQKLETIAGRNSTIVYEGGGPVGDKLYKITDFGRHGITIENHFQRIFIPATKVLQMEFILPVDDYSDRKAAFEKEQIEKVAEAMFEPLMGQLKATFEKEFESPSGELSSSIKSQILLVLTEEGVLVPDPSRSLPRGKTTK